MLIYLVPEAQDYTLSVFRYCLNMDGLLFQGASESVNDVADAFETLDSRWKIHRKIQHGPLPISGRKYSQTQPNVLKRRPNTVPPSPEPRLLHDYELLLRQSQMSGYLTTSQRKLLHVLAKRTNGLSTQQDAWLMTSPRSYPETFRSPSLP